MFDGILSCQACLLVVIVFSGFFWIAMYSMMSSSIDIFSALPLLPSSHLFPPFFPLFLPLPHSSARPVSQTSSMPLSFMPTLDNSVFSSNLIYLFIFNLQYILQNQFFTFSFILWECHMFTMGFDDTLIFTPTLLSNFLQTPPSSPSPTPTSCLLLLFLLLSPTEYRLSGTWMPMVMNHPLKHDQSTQGHIPEKKNKTDFPFLRSQTFSITPPRVTGWRMKTPKALRHPCWDDLIFCRQPQFPSSRVQWAWNILKTP